VNYWGGGGGREVEGRREDRGLYRRQRAVEGTGGRRLDRRP
jgi:hypothetical protein